MSVKHRLAVNLTEGELVIIAKQYDRSKAWIGRQTVLEFIFNKQCADVLTPSENSNAILPATKAVL